MHDIKAIRENPDAFDAALARRGDAPVTAQVLALDEARRAKISAAETAQADQNKASKLVGAAKAKGDEAEFERLRTLVSDKKAEVTAMQAEAKDLDAQLTDMLARIASGRSPLSRTTNSPVLMSVAIALKGTPRSSKLLMWATGRAKRRKVASSLSPETNPAASLIFLGEIPTSKFWIKLSSSAFERKACLLRAGRSSKRSYQSAVSNQCSISSGDIPAE